MLDILLGTAVLALPQGNIALLAGIGAVKGAGALPFAAALDVYRKMMHISAAAAYTTLFARQLAQGRHIGAEYEPRK